MQRPYLVSLTGCDIQHYTPAQHAAAACRKVARSLGLAITSIEADGTYATLSDGRVVVVECGA